MRRSTLPSSFVMCFGLAFTFLLLPGGGPTAIFRTAAIGAALSLALGFLIEARHGVRSLVRADLIMIVALFGLTLVEFFFPQAEVEYAVRTQSATQGVAALFIGFAGLIIGRNFASDQSLGRSSLVLQLSPSTVFFLFVASFCLGYLNMLIAVDFDPAELVRQMLGPRFSQNWSRGTYGGLGDLLGVFGGLLLYLVPAIAGSVLARLTLFKTWQVIIVVLGLLFTLFYGFSSGTRNVFCIYLLLFVASFMLFKPNLTWRFVSVLGFATAVTLYLSAYYMLQFRDVGLASYVESGGQSIGYRKDTLFIDNNLVVISWLTDLFPARFDYLGSEYPLFAALRPVPRALWPAKPERLSVETTDAIGAKGQGLTVTSTFVGEAYMTGGYPAIFVAGLLFGWLAGWWNRFGSNLQSNVNVALYTSGFFAATLSMRSTLWTTTAILPTIIIWLYARFRRARQKPYGFQSIDAKPRAPRPS